MHISDVGLYIFNNVKSFASYANIVILTTNFASAKFAYFVQLCIPLTNGKLKNNNKKCHKRK